MTMSTQSRLYRDVYRLHIGDFECDIDDLENLDLRDDIFAALGRLDPPPTEQELAILLEKIPATHQRIIDAIRKFSLQLTKGRQSNA
jgi:hypothetical protein